MLMKSKAVPHRPGERDRERERERARARERERDQERSREKEGERAREREREREHGSVCVVQKADTFGRNGNNAKGVTGPKSLSTGSYISGHTLTARERAREQEIERERERARLRGSEIRRFRAKREQRKRCYRSEIVVDRFVHLGPHAHSERDRAREREIKRERESGHTPVRNHYR